MTTFSVPGPTTTSDPDREFWRGVLLAGGSTPIPRWPLTPVAGVGQHAGTIPEDLAAALRQLADEIGVPLSSVLLAVHVKVLAALSGERDVTTSYLARPGREDGGGAVPRRPATGAGSWRELLLDTCRAESQLLAHQHFGVGELRSELGLTGRPPETVFDPAEGASGGELDPGTVLGAGIAQYAGRLVLRLRYRADVIDADSAARIFGYYRTALELITDDPDAGHRRQSLLSADELRYQIEGLAGRRRPLPERRFHELFEQRAAAHPHAGAASHGEERWTYRELNVRANRLARALRARGLRREDVVAVVTERNLDWMAAVLGVLKAGGVYLPIEPHFPAGRIATTLSRSRWTLASSPTSSSPRAPPGSPKARCASTPGCSTTCTPRSTIWTSAPGRWSPRPRLSVSTSRSGSWSPHCWPAARPCWSGRR